MSAVEHDRSVLGAYALGALDPAEEQTVHAHVSTCLECQRELAEFVDLREALDQVPPEAFLDGPPEGGDFLLQNTLRRVRAQDPGPSRRFRGLILAAAAVVTIVALGGGIVIGRVTAPEPPATAMPAGTIRAEATNASTGASMRVAVEPRVGWVWVNAFIEGVPAGEECELLVFPREGKPLTAGSWLVGKKGAEEGLPLQGTALIEPGQVKEVRVVTRDGRTMVSVPL